MSKESKNWMPLFNAHIESFCCFFWIKHLSLFFVEREERATLRLGWKGSYTPEGGENSILPSLNKCAWSSIIYVGGPVRLLLSVLTRVELGYATWKPQHILSICIACFKNVELLSDAHMLIIWTDYYKFHQLQ